MASTNGLVPAGRKPAGGCGADVSILPDSQGMGKRQGAGLEGAGGHRRRQLMVSS
jgi:hypothetical protein